MGQQESLEKTYHDYYPLLFSIAYRMFGSASDAEDIVQECYLRYAQAPAKEIHSTKAYLTTIVTHLCLDYLKSAQKQREQYAGVWLPEPILTTDLEDPALHSVEQHESISLAFLLLLERLTPYERAVFLLHDIFSYRYEEIAKIVGKSAPMVDKYSIKRKLISVSVRDVILHLQRKHRNAWSNGSWQLPSRVRCKRWLPSWRRM